MNTLSWMVDDSFSMRLTLALLHFIWQGCCAGIVVFVGGLLLRNASARIRYSLNVAVMLAMVACLPTTFFLINVRSSVIGASQVSQKAYEIDDSHISYAAVELAAGFDTEQVANNTIRELRPTESAGANTSPEPEASIDASAVTQSQWLDSIAFGALSIFPTLSRWISALYFCGVAMVLGRLMRGVWGGRQLRKMATVITETSLLVAVQKLAHQLGLNAAPTVAWCEQISIPVVVGVVRPMILLPTAIVSGLTPDQLQALLLHELSHIRRLDPIVNLLQRIIEAILFFHPVVWFVSRRISTERENAADDMVLAAGWDRPLYADALVRMAELAFGISKPNAALPATILSSAGTTPSEFKQRILRLLGSRPPKLDVSRAGFTMVLVFLIIAGSGMLAWSHADQSDASADTNEPNENTEGITQKSTQPADKLEFRFHVSDAQGKPVAGAKVTPLSTLRLPFEFALDFDRKWCPEVMSDANGVALVTISKEQFNEQRFREAAALPEQENLWETITDIEVRVDHPEYPIWSSYLEASDPAPIILSDPATIEVRARRQDNGKPLSGVMPLFQGYDASPADWLAMKQQSMKEGILTIRRVDLSSESATSLLRLVHIPQEGPAWFSDLIDVTSIKQKSPIVLNPQLRPGVRVSGRLADSVPRPIMNGTVVARMFSVQSDSPKFPERQRQQIGSGDLEATIPQALWSMSLETNIKEDGSFVFESVPADENLQIIVICDGWISRSSTRQEMTGYEKAYDFTIDVEEMLDGEQLPQIFRTTFPAIDVIVPMNRTVDCEVNVVDETGRVIPDAKVSFEPYQNWFPFGWAGERRATGHDSLKQLQTQFQPGVTSQSPAKNERYTAKTDVRGIALIKNIALFNPDSGVPTQHEFSVYHENYVAPPGSDPDPEHRQTVLIYPNQPGRVTVKMKARNKVAETEDEDHVPAKGDDVVLREKTDEAASTEPQQVANGTQAAAAMEEFRGRVLDRFKKPVAAATVVLSVVSGDGYENQERTVATALTDEAGEFRISILSSILLKNDTTSQTNLWAWTSDVTRDGFGLVPIQPVQEQPIEMSLFRPMTEDVELAGINGEPVRGTVERLNFSMGVNLILPDELFKQVLPQPEVIGSFRLLGFPMDLDEEAEEEVEEEESPTRAEWRSLRIQTADRGRQVLMWHPTIRKDVPTRLLMREPALIQGRLTTSSGTLPADLLKQTEIVLRSSDREPGKLNLFRTGMARVRCDSEGRFEVRDLPAGNLTSLSLHMGDVTGWIWRMPRGSDGEPLELPSGAVTSLEIPLIRTRTVRGQIVTQSGERLPNVELHVSHGTIRRKVRADKGVETSYEHGAVVRTDESGEFSVDVVPGSISLSKASSPGMNILTALRWPSDLSIALPGGGLQVDADATPLVLPPLKLTVLTGRVVDHEQQPYKGLVVASGGEQKTAVGVSYSQQDGSFRLEATSDPTEFKVLSIENSNSIPFETPDTETKIISRNPLVLQVRPNEKQATNTERNPTPDDTNNKISSGDSSAAPDWGNPVNGVRARIIPVLSSMSEDAIDPAQRATQFAKAEDIAFVFELENVSDKPIKLVDVFHDKTDGEPIPGADWSSQFVFSIDLFDDDGKLIEQPEIEVDDVVFFLPQARVAILKPGMTQQFLIKPDRWLATFKSQIRPGKSRVAVRYHWLSTPNAARTITRNSPLLEATAVDVTSASIGIEVGGENGKPDLVWGEAINGLRAAMLFVPPKATHAHGETPGIRLHLQNVGAGPLKLVSDLSMPSVHVTVRDDKGEPVDIDDSLVVGRMGTGMRGLVTLKPQQILVLDTGNLGLAISEERADLFDERTQRKLITPAGKYSIQLAASFSNVLNARSVKGQENVVVNSAWVGEIKSGKTPLTISTAPEVGMEFLQPYPKLHGLSSDMTEPQFLEIVKQQELKARKTIDGEKVTYHIALDDGHTLIVMFDKNAECSGIQRVSGEDVGDQPAAARRLGAPAVVLPDHLNVMAVGFDRNSKDLVTVATENNVAVRVWDLAEKKLKREVKLETDKHGNFFLQGQLTLSGDRQRVIAILDGKVTIWDTANGKLVKTLALPKEMHGFLHGLTATPDLSLIACGQTHGSGGVGTPDAHAVVWDVATGRMLRTVKHTSAVQIQSLALSPDGKFLATGGQQGGTCLWDMSTGTLLHQFPNDNAGRRHRDPEVSESGTNQVLCLRFSPDGQQLALGDMLGVKMVEVKTGKLLFQCEAPFRFGRSGFVFSKDGQLLARVGTDKIVPIWSAQTGELLVEIPTEAHNGSFSDNGRSFAVGFSDDKQATAVWNLSLAAASADGKAAINPNGEIIGRLIDAATGKPVEGATIACGAVINDSLKGGGANAVTDAEGRYRLPVPSPGIYNVWLKKLDEDAAMTAAADDGLLVEAGKVTTSQLLLVKGRKVAGKVVDAGKPLASMGVSCYSAARPQSGGIQSTKTNEEGAFEFSLPPGRAQVYVVESVAKSNDNPLGIGRYADAHLTVSATEAVAPIVLMLKQHEARFDNPEWLNRSTPGTQIIRHTNVADVTGTVVDTAGNPIVGARVFRDDGSINLSDDKGEFKVSIDKGTQLVMHAFAPGYHIWFGTPTAGDVLKIVMEKKNAQVAVNGKTNAAIPLDQSALLADGVRTINAENNELRQRLDQPALTDEQVIAVQATRPNAAATTTDAKTILAKELASFQGTWCWDFSQPWTWPRPIGVGTDSDGRKSEKRWVIEGNQITWVGRDGQRVYVTFTIDPFKAPKQLEFTFFNGPYAGKKSIGIYEPVNGDEKNLWLCMSDPGSDAPRPTDISAGSPKKQSMISIYKVTAPAKPSAENELKRLQGLWNMTLCDSTHRTFGGTQQEASKWQWTIKDDEILWSRQGEVWKLKLNINPPKSPREMDLTFLNAPFEMDLTFLDGPFQGVACQGIFGWGGVDGQSLMIAIQDPGSDAPRPIKFHMSSDVKTGLWMLRPSKPSDVERELTALQGTWTLRNFDTGNFERNKDPSTWPLPGGKGPDKSGEGSELRWTIKGNDISWTSSTGQEIEASFTIDSHQSPKQIDLTFLRGPNKGETCPGIYRRGDLDENILWLCMADPGSNSARPKEFSYQWGEGRSVLSLYPFNPPEPSTAESSEISQP